MPVVHLRAESRAGVRITRQQAIAKAFEVMAHAEKMRLRDAEFCGECGRKNVWHAYHYGYSPKTGNPLVSGQWRCPSWWCRFRADFNAD